ncbi:hypothetical protein [Tropicibacter sp. S64]|uniref:hypothetical protein n=1 Tax=Tropicibacter sp. S64 TaxID=3415122 RepID=UPI003C79F46C
MLDFGDIFETFVDAGGEGRGWRSWWAILGALVGLAVAGWIGFQTNGIVGALVGLPAGALIGWVVALFLRGIGLFLLILAAVLAISFGWSWLFGGS